jgi:hypothetical protein
MKSRRMGWAGYVVRMGEMRNVFRTWIRNNEGKRSLGGPRRRWENNFTRDLAVRGWEVVDRMYLPQDRDR